MWACCCFCGTAAAFVHDCVLVCAMGRWTLSSLRVAASCPLASPLGTGSPIGSCRLKSVGAWSVQSLSDRSSFKRLSLLKTCGGHRQ